MGLLLLNRSADEEISFKRFSIALGMLLIICLGWLLSLCMYWGVSFGFLYGWKELLYRSKVTSRKLTVCSPVSFFRPNVLKKEWSSFLSLSNFCFLILLWKPRPPSLSRAKLMAGNHQIDR